MPSILFSASVTGKSSLETENAYHAPCSHWQVYPMSQFFPHLSMISMRSLLQIFLVCERQNFRWARNGLAVQRSLGIKESSGSFIVPPPGATFLIFFWVYLMYKRWRRSSRVRLKSDRSHKVRCQTTVAIGESFMAFPCLFARFDHFETLSMLKHWPYI